MRLAGYLKALKENSFAVPVYTDKTQYFFHAVDENYRIFEFYNADISLNQINEYYISDDFEINDYAAIVFIGKKNYININKLNKGIEEVKKYLGETTLEKEYLNVKEDVDYFINCLVVQANDENWIPITTNDNIIYQGSVYRNSLIGQSKLSDLNSSIDITDYLLEESFSKFLSESNFLIKFLKENNEIKVNFINYVIQNEKNINLQNIILNKLNEFTTSSEIKRALKKFNHKFLKTVSVEPIKHASLPVVDYRVVEVDGSMRVLPSPIDTRMDVKVLPNTGYYYPKFYYGFEPNDEKQNPSKKVLRKKK